ncbi:MAG: hypothetical protein E7340_02850 [Clostridiales bacterium]|nr:hypothetical protein [Clostridiales bacterium]
MQEYFKILGLSENATDEEIEFAYQKLKNQYSRDRFLEGDPGNRAARMLTKVETAYHEIMAVRKSQSETESESAADLSEVDRLIRNGDITAAQEALDNVRNRTAEWHYLQSVVFYKKNWVNESKKQLEIALSMDPHNQKYADDFAKLKQKMEYNEKQFKGAQTQDPNQQDIRDRQMGGEANNCLSFCATWCCIDMMCSMCCR